MIAYVFLALGTVGTAGVLYAVAPAGRGLHRYVAPRSVLRAEADRSSEAAEELACQLVGLASELDGVKAERDDTKAAMEKAGLRITDLEEQVRDRDQLRERVTALTAELANARKIRPLPPHGDTPPPSARVIPLHQAPFAAVSPAVKPS